MPKYRIDRIPSGIHFLPQNLLNPLYVDEPQSDQLPETWVHGQDIPAIVPRIDRNFQYSAQRLGQQPGPSNTTLFVKQIGNVSHEPRGSSESYAARSIPTQSGGNPQHLPLQRIPTSRLPDSGEVPDDCLPLLNVNVDVLVDGSICRTRLLQRFSNTSKETIREARYTFPLYDGAVVVAFTCIVGKERELVGKVRAKDEAKKQFKKAIERQETAGLLEEHTPEIFETVLGNIPAKTDVSIHIDYIHEIKSSILDSGEHVLELILPMSIAPRYGDLDVDGPANSGKNIEADGLAIVVRVNDSSKIKKLHCSPHFTVEENLPVQSTVVSSFSDLHGQKGQASIANSKPPMYTIARYTSSNSIMDEDFIISIENHPSHPIRSRAVLSSVDEYGRAALMVSLKPAEIFKTAARADRFEGEIIFVLDRSASMSGKISTLVHAMLLSLVSLPKTCKFNIVSFGTGTEFMWKRSKPYTQTNLQDARAYVQKISANFGGTNLSHALEMAVGSRADEDPSTQLIVLTDGEVEPEGVLLTVWNARKKFGSVIRFFALGIGHNVPHRFIDRIGDLGGGFGEVIDLRNKPEWTERLSLMLSAGIMPKTWSCEIDLGPGFERQSLFSNLLGSTAPQNEQGATKPDGISFVQGPYPIPPMHPFTFQSTFFLLDLRSGDAPRQLSVKATTTYAKDSSVYVLPVEDTTSDSSAIQHLAVKAILLNMEAELNQKSFSLSQKDCGRQNAVNLGVQYSIASRWTSFVAVEGLATVVDEVEIYRAAFRQGNIEDYLDLGSPRSSAFRPSSTFAAFPTIHLGGHEMQGEIEDVMSPMSRSDFEVPSMFPIPQTLSSMPSRRYSMLGEQGESRDSIFHRKLGTKSSKPGRISRLPSAIRLGWERKMKANSDTEERVSPEDPFRQKRRHLLWRMLIPWKMSSDTSVLASTRIKGEITWETAVDAQNAIGLFDIRKYVQGLLCGHFRQHTAKSVTRHLSSTFPAFERKSLADRAMVVDTIMLIHYFQTHSALGKDTWYMMIDKAESAVLEVVGGEKVEELAGTWEILDLSAMHEHLDEHLKGQFVQNYCPFLIPGVEVCQFCLGRGRSSDLVDADGVSRQMLDMNFDCLKRDCDFTVRGVDEIRKLWEHMVNCEHLCNEG